MDLYVDRAGEWERRLSEATKPPAPTGINPASRPIRIAMLGWAWLSAQAAEGSGLNLSVSELAAGLAAMGHRVHYLRSGMDYSLRPGMWIELAEVWRGIGCFRLFNSPNLSPGNFNFHNVKGQIESPRHSALVVEWARAMRIDAVHIHSLEGFGFDLVLALRQAGFPVFITPHNYYALCPQVDLLHKEQRTCDDYQGGTSCRDCLWHAPNPDQYRNWRRRTQTAERWLGHDALFAARERWRMVRESGLRRVMDGPSPAPILNGPATPPPLPAMMPVADEDENQRVLRRRELVVLNDFGHRREAGVRALSAATAVFCPSRFLLRVHESHGVDPGVLRHVPLGQPHFDTLRREAESSPHYRQAPWRPGCGRPLRLAYFGNCYPNKGLSTLVRAMMQLPTDLAARIHCSIRASGHDAPFRSALAGLAHTSFLGGYDVRQLPAAMREFEVTVFPNMGLENSPFVVLEGLHAGKFLIASRLGGGTDWIHEGRNGLLFRAGDVGGLIGRIDDLVSGRVTIPTPAEIHDSSTLRSYPEYVSEVSSMLETAATINREKEQPA